MKERKGIILAGGAGTRLHPLTVATSKQLLPVFDKPMIYYPLTTLMLAGMRDILLITTPEDQATFKKVLGTGEQWGVNLAYAVQPVPNGLAQAFVIGADFVHGHPSCLILGDNIIYGHGLPELLRGCSERSSGASLLAYQVDDPERYGVVLFDESGQPTCIHEKPRTPTSRWAVIGLYFYDETVVDRARDIRPSARGEYEITDLNNSYLEDGHVSVERLGRGFAWLDAGTHESLLQAAEFVRVLQARQGQLIASPEEVAFAQGWISREELEALARQLDKTAYGRALLERAQTRS